MMKRELTMNQMEQVNGGGILEALEYASDRAHCFFGMHGDTYCAANVCSCESDTYYLRYECTICGKSMYYKQKLGGEEVKISEEEYNSHA